MLRGSGKAAAWGSSVWTLMGISVVSEKDSAPGKASPQPSPVHTWCLVKRGPWLGRAVSFIWCSWHPLKHQQGFLISWHNRNFVGSDLGIFVQEEEDTFCPRQKMIHANCSRLAILILTWLQCVAKKKSWALGGFVLDGFCYSTASHNCFLRFPIKTLYLAAASYYFSNVTSV